MIFNEEDFFKSLLVKTKKVSIEFSAVTLGLVEKKMDTHIWAMNSNKKQMMIFITGQIKETLNQVFSRYTR
jgi:Zn-dependent peptidase ImmA (M78 family)